MIPLPTPAEVASAQVACREAWELSLLTTGMEKMKLIAQSFPFANEKSHAEGWLYLHWHPNLKSFSVSDLGGFITLIPEADTHVLIGALKMEFQQQGAFRELITGEKAKPRRQPPKKFVRTQKLHISLGDLDL